MIEAETWAATLAYGGSAGFGLGFAFLVVRWFAMFIAGRQDAREAHLDSAMKLLIGQLQQQVKELIEHKSVVDRRLQECLERDIEKDRRIAQLEGLTVGLGDARQHAQLIVSAEKAKEKK